MNLLAVFERLKKTMPVEFLEQLLNLPALKIDQMANLDEDILPWIEQLREKLNEQASASVEYSIAVNGENDELVISRKVHGIANEKTISIDFFNGSDYELISRFIEQVNDLFTERSYILRGDKKQQVTRFSDVYVWLMNEAKKGQSIQRYKGLGEMNPEQLWETTMDPNTRRLLQVRIEDAIAADEVFTTLMGDQVEPRRDFIETNALNVGNLDV